VKEITGDGVRIPGDGDKHSELSAIAIPK